MIAQWFLGSRKFLVMLLVVLVGVGFRVLGLVNGAELVSLLSSIGVAFMGANTVEHMFSAAKEWAQGRKEKEEE